jgi:hypothetical protein
VQIFNQFNARKIKDEYNIFGGILKSTMFLYVAVIILAFQVRCSIPAKMRTLAVGGTHTYL